jgi:hypothetical protein
MPMEGLPGACLLCIFIFLAMLPFNYIKSNLMMPHVQLWKLMLLGAKTGGIPQQVGCANGKSSWKIERSEHTHNKNKCRQNTNEIFFLKRTSVNFKRVVINTTWWNEIVWVIFAKVKDSRWCDPSPVPFRSTSSPGKTERSSRRVFYFLFC